jgi:hypothetical protein
LKFLNSQCKVQYQLAESNFDNERKKIEELLKFYGDTNSTVGKGERVHAYQMHAFFLKKINGFIIKDFFPITKDLKKMKQRGLLLRILIWKNF